MVLSSGNVWLKWSLSWFSQYCEDVLGTNHDMTAKQELVALKKEVVQLKQERDIFKKVSATLVGTRNKVPVFMDHEGFYDWRNGSESQCRKANNWLLD